MIDTKSQCLLMTLLFGKVLLSFTTREILGLLAIVGFEVNKAFVVIFDIWLILSVVKFCL